MIEKIAHNLGRRDEKPNIALAEELVSTQGKGIEEIVEGLDDENRNVAGDCIKVLYETGYRNPALIAPYAEKFLRLLNSRNNRLVWGAMTALAAIAPLRPDFMFGHLESLIKSYERGSVITVDSAVVVMAETAARDLKYEKEIFPFLLDHLRTCGAKFVPSHSEKILVCIRKENAEMFIETVKKRFGALSDAQKKRTDKVLRQAEQRMGV